MLVLEHAVEHDEFLAAIMRVGREPAAGAIANDRGRPRHFTADPV